MILENTLYSNTSKTFMNPDTNTTNISNLINILEYWYLDGDSSHRVLDGILSPPSVCGSIQLGEDHRLWHKQETNANTDQSYKEYHRIIHYHRQYIINQIGVSNLDQLLRYETWITGKIQGQKLFKYIKTHKLLSDDTVESITSSRNTSELYLCISKNPVDFLFASTNQPFTSCVNLTSNHGAGFYMGIPEQWVDPFKYIVFITPGKLRSYKIKGYEFKHFKYIQRAIAYTDGKRIGLGRAYPQVIIDIPSNAPKTWGIQPTTDSYEDYIVLNLNVPIIYFENGDECIAYNDARRMYEGYSLNHASGSPIDINWSNGFENLDSLDSGEHEYVCDSCGCRLREGEECSVGDYYICEGCYDDNYSRCELCDEIHHRDSTTWIHDQPVCDYCRTEGYTYCVRCGEYEDNDNVTRDHMGRAFCETCRDEDLAYCDCCCEYVERTDTYTIKDETICDNCISHYKNS